MIATELSKGQGLGNQLFCYVTIRSIADRLGYDFSILGQETMANNIHSSEGLGFMDLDYGVPSRKEEYTDVRREREDRIFSHDALHDMEHGIYVTGTDEELLNTPDGVLWYGNMQAEDYFRHEKKAVAEWLKVKDEYVCDDFSDPDVCVLHLRCSDYLDHRELFLRKSYWENGMRRMKERNDRMRFVIITNDVEKAGEFLPGIPAYNFSLAKDYSILNRARNLLLANSSFSFFPAYTDPFGPFIIAPKYWARHNTSGGFWASEQNIYDGWNYMDRQGKLSTAEECRRELAQYKQSAGYTAHLNRPLPAAEKAVWTAWYRAQMLPKQVYGRLLSFKNR